MNWVLHNCTHNDNNNNNNHKNRNQSSFIFPEYKCQNSENVTSQTFDSLETRILNLVKQSLSCVISAVI